VYKIVQRAKPAALSLILGAPMDLRKTVARNREIFDGFQTGQSVESLAGRHGLSVGRVRTVLVDEKNKRSFSPEPFYRALRSI
jgi:Mor family transcriptional regulator